MAHFAILDDSNTVTSVIVVSNDVITDGDGVEQEQLGIDFLTTLYGSGNYVQSSYNNNFRKHFARIGGTYDSVKDKFIAPQAHLSWSLDENDDWQAPIAYPGDLSDGAVYTWVESAYQNDNTKGWIEMDSIEVIE